MRFTTLRTMSPFAAKALILIAICLPVALSLLSRLVAVDTGFQRWVYGLVEFSFFLVIPTTTVLSVAGTITLFRSPNRPPSVSDMTFYIVGMCVGVLGIIVCV
jgi:hypothetical protein